MRPELSIAHGGGLEIELIALLAIAAVAAAVWRPAGEHAPERRKVALFGAYFFGIDALVLLRHALVGSGPLVLSSYTLVFVAAVLCGWLSTYLHWPATGLPQSLAPWCMVGTLAFGLAGSRVAEMLFELGEFPSLGEWARAAVDPRRQGLGVLGGFVANFAFLWLVLRRRGPDALARVCDACASSIYLTFGLGRFGCLLAGCCFGRPAAGPWSIAVDAFAPGTPAAAHYAASPALRIVATQPIEAVAILSLAAAAELIHCRRASLGLRPGAVTAFAVLGYGVVRFAIELMRADSPRSVAGVLTVWQLLALALAAFGFAWWRRARAVAA